MALSVKVGSFDLPAATGAFSVTGVGFQPKLLLFFYANRNAFHAGAPSDPFDIGFGAAASASQEFAGSAYAQDNVTPSNDKGIWGNDSSINIYRSAGDQARANLTAMDADGFSMNVSIAPSSTRKIIFLALGGTDITNVAVGAFDHGTGATGNQAVTGLGFQPDCLILSSMLRGTTENTAQTNAQFCLGAALSSTVRRAITALGRDAQTNSIEKRSQSNAHVLIQTNSSEISAAVDLASFDADGFTIDREVTVDVAFRIGYIAIKGAQFAIGGFQQPVSAAPVTQQVTGLTISPAAVLFFGASLDVQDGSFQGISAAAMGVAAGSDQGYVATRANDNVQPTNNTTKIANDKVIGFVSALSGIQAEAAFTGFLSDGWELNWTTIDDATPRYVFYLAVGSVASSSSSCRSSSSCSSCRSSSSSSCRSSSSCSSSRSSSSSCQSSSSSSRSSGSSSSCSSSSSCRSSSSSYSSSSSISISATKDYSRGSYDPLPTDTADLVTLFSPQNYADVANINGVYVGQASTGGHAVFLFKESASSDLPFTVTWVGRSTRDAFLSPIVLQLYNRTTGLWVTVAQEINAAAGAQVLLSHTQLSNLSDYFNVSHEVAARVYQQAV